MPYLRAHLTICAAVSPALTEPRPTSPSSLTPASASSLKSDSTMPSSMTGAPASIFTPDGRKFSYQRCEAIAIAFNPTISLAVRGHEPHLPKSSLSPRHEDRNQSSLAVAGAAYNRQSPDEHGCRSNRGSMSPHAHEPLSSHYPDPYPWHSQYR